MPFRHLCVFAVRRIIMTYYCLVTAVCKVTYTNWNSDEELSFKFTCVCKITKTWLLSMSYLSPPPLNNSAFINGRFIKFDICYFSKICRRKRVLFLNLTIKTDTVHEHTFMIKICWILLTMRNISDKSCKENENTHFILQHFFPQRSCTLMDNVEKYGRSSQGRWLYNTTQEKEM